MFSRKAEREFSKLDHQTQKRIRNFLRNKLLQQEAPKNLGKPMTGEFSGCWRYRVGDYRIICEFQNDRMIIYALSIGHRKKIYETFH